MASVIEICNYALQELGANSITSLNEGTTEANECSLRYESCRQSLLSMHPWNFAVKRAQLAREVATPEFGYAYQYALPADFLFMLKTSLEEDYETGVPSLISRTDYIYDNVSRVQADKYVMEDGKLLSHDDSVKVVYIADRTDSAVFSATFVELLSRYLASKIAYRVTGSKSERDTQYALFQKEFEYFQSIDSQQGVVDSTEISQYLSARL